MSEKSISIRFGATMALGLRYRDGDGERTVWPALRPKAALCYHGGLWVGDVADALGSLLREAGRAVS
jgi:hypothetical protein